MVRCVVAYHEADGVQPPRGLSVKVLPALDVSPDELLRIEPLKRNVPPQTARIRRRLQRVEDPPPADQQVNLKFVDALVESRGSG